jgi:uncharacterized protein YjbI with pentapeptide repeats
VASKRAPQPPDLDDDLRPFAGEGIDAGGDYADTAFVGCTFQGEQAEGLSFDRVSFERVHARESRLARLRVVDARFLSCDLANSACSASSVRRAELRDCRLVGFGFSEGRLDDVHLVGCKIDLAVFQHTRFSHCRFEDCDLRGADFEGADLRGATFRDCDLREARMVDARLEGTDFRGSRVEGLLVQPGRLAGALIDPTQAVDFAGLVGLVVRSRSDEGS